MLAQTFSAAVMGVDSIVVEVEVDVTKGQVAFAIVGLPDAAVRESLDRVHAAMRNMRRALRPGGRMVHIVWRDREDNPWLSMAKDVVLEFLPPPGDDAQTCGPGPFSMADEQMVRAMMQSAGYEQIEFRRVDTQVLIGNDVKDAIAFQLAIGPAGEVFREAGAEAEEKRAEIELALAEAINAQKVSADGIVMDSSSWVISAINPAS